MVGDGAVPSFSCWDEEGEEGGVVERFNMECSGILSPGLTIFLDLWNVLPAEASLNIFVAPTPTLAEWLLPISSVNEDDSEYCSTDITGDMALLLELILDCLAEDVVNVAVMDLVLTVCPPGLCRPLPYVPVRFIFLLILDIGVGWDWEDCCCCCC